MRRAFTLIELMAVCAIVAILAAIVFSVGARAIASAKNRTCASNLGQIGAAALIYAKDSDDTLPPYLTTALTDHGVVIPANPTGWRDCLLPYVGSRAVFYCPFDTLRGPMPGDGSYDTSVSSYETLPIVTKGGDRLPDFYGERGSFRLPTAGIPTSNVLYARDMMYQGEDQEWYTAHGNAVNELYLDGHVKSGPAH